MLGSDHRARVANTRIKRLITFSWFFRVRECRFLGLSRSVSDTCVDFNGES